MESKKQSKNEKLKHYSTREPFEFIQFDCFQDVEAGDGVVRPDEDRDCLFCGRTTELMSGVTAIRVLLHPDMKPEDVARGLRKIIEWIQREPELLAGGSFEALELRRRKDRAVKRRRQPGRRHKTHDAMRKPAILRGPVLAVWRMDAALRF